LNMNLGAVPVAALGGRAPLLLPVLFCGGLLNWKEDFGGSDVAAVDVVPLVVGIGENTGLGASADLVDPNVPLGPAPVLPKVFVA